MRCVRVKRTYLKFEYLKKDAMPRALLRQIVQLSKVVLTKTFLKKSFVSRKLCSLIQRALSEKISSLNKYLYNCEIYFSLTENSENARDWRFHINTWNSKISLKLDLLGFCKGKLKVICRVFDLAYVWLIKSRLFISWATVVFLN